MGAHAHTYANNPDDALRRIGKLEAARRRVGRSLARCTPGSGLAAELARQSEELDEQIGHLRAVVARAEATGFKVWSAGDFAPGDLVQYAGTWYEVLRVNRRSVTVPHAHPGAGDGVVRALPGMPLRTWTVGFRDGITGRIRAGENGARGPHPDTD
jgi:hypothetical protein